MTVDPVNVSVLRVLLVEDSEADAELIEELLHDTGLNPELVRVETAEALSRELMERDWDIILTDYDLPGFSGLEAIAMVRRNDFDIPVILVSGAAGEERAIESLQAGAADYVLKQALARLPHAVSRALREVDDQREHRAAQERTRQLAAIVESTDVAIIGKTLDGTITSWNRSAEQLHGYTAEQAIGRNIDMLSPAGKHDEMAEILERVATGGSVGLETTRLHQDGKSIAVSIIVSPVFDKNGTIFGASSIVRDITALQQAENLRRASDERYRILVESSLDGIVTADVAGVVTFANHKSAELLGYEAPAQLIGTMLLDIVAQDYQVLANSGMRKVLEHGAVDYLRCRCVRVDGTSFPAELNSSLTRDPAGEPSGTTATIRDVTDRAAYEEQLQHLALHDSLTSLPNRTLLRDRLEQALLNRRSADSPVSILFVDLDEFKAVNDTFGHHHGDEVLKEVSRRLQSQVRESDTVARAGGDEFLLVLPGADTTAALVRAGKILRSLGEPIELEGQQIIVGASIGIANRPDHSDELSTLLRFADIAMYRAKREKSGCAIYMSSEDSSTVDQFVLIRDLRKGIQQGELFLHYQPQVDIRTSTVRGVEALVRWQHPTKGMVPPDQFIELAEHAGLMRALTTWVVREAARQSAVWRLHGLDIAIAVNLSADNLHDSELLGMILDAVESHGARPNTLAMEITETSIMSQPNSALITIERLNALNMRISIDDFGTGYSSLGYLKRFPAHELKIDKSFILDMKVNADDAVIVSAIIDLGHKLKLEVVAEGVEDQETLDLLIDAGCDIVQGYYISRPVTAGAFEAWLHHEPSQLELQRSTMRNDATRSAAS